MRLLVNLKRPEMNADGSMSFGEAYCVCLKVGNVSVAFDTRAFKPNRDNVFQFEYADSAWNGVELNDEVFDGCVDNEERLLFALAADLGYDLVKKG